MQTRNILAVAVVGGALAWFGATQGGQPQRLIEFTAPASPPPATLDLKNGVSPVKLQLPVDLDQMLQRADKALPANLSTLHELLPDAACGQRKHGRACTYAQLDGAITRNGPLALKVAPQAITLSIPVHYILSATGRSWADTLTETKSGDTSFDLVFAITVNPAGDFDVTRYPNQTSVKPSPTDDDHNVPLLSARVSLSRVLDHQLKAVEQMAADDLRRALAGLPVRKAVNRAWDVLTQPAELGQGSAQWLKGTPDYYSAGAFVSDPGKLSFQIPIASHLTVSASEKSPGVMVRRAAVLSQENPPPDPAGIRFALPVDLEAMRRKVDAAFTNGQLFESYADRFSKSVKVKVRSTRLYPAHHLIGLELIVDVTDAKGFVQSGKLNLAGRPVIDLASATVTLADIAFPPVADPARGIQDLASKGTVTQPSGIPRIGVEPFASILAASAKLDIARTLADSLPLARQMLDHRIATDLDLNATLARSAASSLELTADGAWLVVDLGGDITLTYTGPQERVDIPVLMPIAAANSRPMQNSPAIAASAMATAPLTAASMLPAIRPASASRKPNRRYLAEAHTKGPTQPKPKKHADTKRPTGQTTSSASARTPSKQTNLGLWNG